jgi:predicted DNA-binding protein
LKHYLTLDYEQSEKLRVLAKNTKIPQAALVREALDYLFRTRKEDLSGEHERTYTKV